ncbi:hypothetical protein RFI_08842 [Reticulomyxa filosa]|uniref:PAP-associated domain-containing protein n=1 Tax=Reticulomyxa filosa TaxID=46433 RepID=X6NRD7_RETFI|nr:hypothetical protein RFI_08842 [Reticulomyxa filosa]|eukprot:ETO28289.1 hypothetical protein RFI_08842 [Reticulomyxa filosa]
MHNSFTNTKEDEGHSIDCDCDETICKGYLSQFPNVNDFPMQMTLSLSYVTKCSTNNSLFNVVNYQDNNYCHVVEIGLKFTCDNGLHECLEWFQNIPFPYSIRHNMWSINCINFSYPFDTILHMMQTYVPIQHTVLLDQVFARGIDKEIFRFWQNHNSQSKRSKASKAQFVSVLDDIAIEVFGHNTNFYKSFEDLYETSSGSEEIDESSNWGTNKSLHFSNRNKQYSNAHWRTSKHDEHTKNSKKSHKRIVVVGSSAQGLDLITSDIDCCLLIEGTDHYDRDSCIVCLTEFANFLKDVWILRSSLPQSKADLTKSRSGGNKQGLPNSRTSRENYFLFLSYQKCDKCKTTNQNIFLVHFVNQSKIFKLKKNMYKQNIAPKDNANIKKWKHEKKEDVKEYSETEQQDQDYKLNVTTLFNAKVPIIKLYDPITNVSCDVGILMSDNSIKTTNYLRQLLSSCRDPRPTMLLICIKYWSYKRRINDAYRGFMNSYGYVLLAIKYLQILQPPLLPVLEASYADHLNYNPYSDSSFSMKPVFGTIKPDECKKNSMYLTDLLHGFFEYYSYFDFGRGIVNVAEVGVSPKATTHPYLGNGSKEFNDEWNSFVNPIHFHSLVVEDPFDKDNNVAKNVDHINLGIIRQEIIRAKNMFVEGKHWADICAPKNDC